MHHVPNRISCRSENLTFDIWSSLVLMSLSWAGLGIESGQTAEEDAETTGTYSRSHSLHAVDSSSGSGKQINLQAMP